MTVGFRAANSASVTASGSSATVTKPAGTVDTDFMIAFQTIGSSGSQAGLTGPAGWTDEGFGGVDANTGVIEVWTKIASSEPASWTWGKVAAVGNMCVSVLSFSNPAATPMDGTEVYDFSTTAGLTATSSGLVTAFTNDILVVCIMANAGGPSISVPTGMTSQTNPIAGTTNTHRVCTETIASTGATGTRAATLGTSQKWVTAAVAVSNFLPSGVRQEIIQSRAALQNASNF